ncbi:MAG: signal peptidase I [Treponemataceae bacterium]|nr:signal peptidase I [Treponemataceae bacterium]
MNLVLKFLVFPTRITSEAMEPGLPKNSFILVAPNYSSWNISIFDRTFERGSVVYLNPLIEDDLPFYKKAVNFLVSFFTFQQYRVFVPDNKISGNPSLRRVVGIPGDSIYMKDYVVYIKPAGEKHFLTEFELTPKMYEVLHPTDSKCPANIGIPSQLDEIVLGEDEYFILADDRGTSVDSRLYGSIEKSKIGGKALLLYFPVSAFGVL